MIIVSDTTPLHYLILINKADLLPTLFGRILIPEAVFAEITRERAPIAVREWMKTPPEWLEIRSTTYLPEDITGLGKGETEAVALAIEEKAEAVLMDDRKAIREAREHDLVVITTLGILELAARKEMIDLEGVIGDLRQTSFRLPAEEIVEEFLRRNKNRS